MRRAILSFLLFATPAAMFADTVIMKDGTRYTGTFVRGTSRMVTITDDSGSRRNLDLTDVQQISFGEGYASNDNGYSNQNGNSTYGNSSSRDVNDAVGRLRDDIRTTLNTSNLNTSQRDTLQRASDRLGNALNDYRSGNRVDMQEVRGALSDVRYVVDNSSINYDDRQRLSDDLQQINQLRVSNGNWSNGTGTRSRRYDYNNR